MTITIRPLPVAGESILITTPDFVMLVDGGKPQTNEKSSSIVLRKYLNEIKEIDLVILTHTDSDHIGGLIELLKNHDKNNFKIKEIWFNTREEIRCIRFSSGGTNTSVRQAESFLKRIDKLGIPYNKKDITTATLSKEYFLSDTLSINILSPTAETLQQFYNEWREEIYFRNSTETSGKTNDYHKTIEQLSSEPLPKKDGSVPNGSSIAFILNYNNKKFLFSGDAFSDVMLSSLNELGYSEIKPLVVELFKLPHHGSARNISDGLIKAVSARSYLICSMGMRHLPDKKTLSYLVKEKKEKAQIFATKNLTGMFLKHETIDHLFDLKCLDKELSFE